MNDKTRKGEGFAPLADVVNGIRKELLKAQSEKSSDIDLVVQDIEVELTTAVTKEAGGKLSLKVPFWDTGVEANGKLNAVNTQKVKISLKAKPPAKEGERNDDDFLLSGEDD